MRLPFAAVDDTGLGRSAYLRTVLGALPAPLILAGGVALWLAASSDARTVLLTLGISGILVVGYQVFVGSTGIVSFGHMAFMAVGAYTAGILTTPVLTKSVSLADAPFGLAEVHTSLFVAILAAGLVAAVLALISGIGLMRTTGAAAGVSTLALLVIVDEILSNAKSLTRGTETFYGVPGNLGIWTVFTALAVVTVIAVAFKFSSFGLRARAGRDAPLAAETTGIPVLRGRMAAWVISAFITGVAGALYAHQLTAFSPTTFSVSLAIPIIVMAVLGGLNSVFGCLVGATLLTAWLEFMRNAEAGSVFGFNTPELRGASQLTVGIGLLVLLWLRPRGLLDGKEIQLRSWRSSPAGHSSRRGGA